MCWKARSLQLPERRAAMSRYLRLCLASCLLLAAVVAVVSLTPTQRADAAPSVPFAPRFQTNDNGAVSIIGNNLETCPATAANCLAARAGAAKLNNNSFAMVNQDVDADPSTFNSSNALLTVPTGGAILWAGLYWGARQSKGTGGVAGVGNRASVAFRVPGATGYQIVAASSEFGPTASDLAYQEFANVTGAVQAAGAGTYWGANVVAGTGEDRYAGWSLVVVLRDPSLPLRNLTVFDGFADVGQGSPQTITVSGFRTPKTGPVDTQVGVVAYEGDYSTSGDSATLNTTQLGTPLSPGSNFFNGTNDDRGVSVTARTPNDLNMLGFDIKNVGASNVLPNDSTSAQLNLVSSGDRYFPGVVTTAINLFAPDFSPSTKSVADLAGNTPALPGDTLRYSLTYVNDGGDPATNVVLTDPLPGGTSYVPGSLRVGAGANPGAKTDVTGDDQAEYLAATRSVRFRLGTGATGAVGGTLAPAASTTVTFAVVLDAAAGGTTVTNRATLDYVAATLGNPFSYLVQPVSTPVAELADVSIDKTLAPDPTVIGGSATATLTVRNNGPTVARAVVVTDPAPDGATVTAATSTIGDCTIVAGDVRCLLGDLANGGTATITITASVPATSVATSLTDTATVSSSTNDPDLGNNTAGASVSLSPSANLSVRKVLLSADPAVPGSTSVFSVTVSNAGPSVARGVTLTDVVGPRVGLSLTGAPDLTGAPGATCETPAPAGVQCAIQALAPGQSRTFQYSAASSSSLDGGVPLDNTASVVAQTPDPDDSDNVATATVTTAAPVASLSITKTVDQPTVTAGGQVRFEVIVNNDLGPSDANGVTLSDVLPTGLAIISASPSRGTCTVAGTVTCALGTLVAGIAGVLAGGSATIEIVADVSPDAQVGILTNTATASAADAPAIAAQAAMAITSSADLVMRKTASGSPTNPAAPVVAGGDVYYRIVATNQGPSTARSVSIADQLATAFVLVSATGPGGVVCPPPVAGSVTCAIGDLAPDATATVLVRMSVPATYDGGPAPDTATVDSSTPDPSPANNAATYTTTTGVSADLSVTKQASIDPVVAGTTVDYRVTATNAGPSAATAVVLTDALPAGLTFVSATGCTATGQNVRCVVGTLLPRGARTFVIRARAAPDVAPGSSLTDTARVTSPTRDPSPSNNLATVDSAIIDRADVTVQKLASAASGPAGQPVAFLVRVTNNGPSVASGVSMVDHFDADAAINPAQLPPRCAILQGDVECALGDLDPGQTIDIQIPTAPLSSLPQGTYLNRASVGSATPDSNPTNNVATVPYTITAPVADLRLTKAATTSPLVAGATFSYELTVGPDPQTLASDASAVRVVDTLPAGLLPTAASTTQGSCDIAGQTVTCLLGTVAGLVTQVAGAAPVIAITGTVASGLTGSVTNTGTVTTPTTLTPQSVTSATVTTPVVQRAELTLTKTPDVTPIVAGSVVNYTVVVGNTGPSDAQAVRVTDPLPAGLVFDRAASDPACALTAGRVVCAIGVLPAGDNVSVVIAARLAPAYAGTTLANTATADSPTSPEGATATDTSDVVRQAKLVLVKGADTETPNVGTSFSYTISLTNDGPSTAPGATIDDTLPAGVVLTSVTPESAGVTCTSAAGPPASIACSAGTLQVGQTATVVLDVTLPDDFAPGALPNTAAARADDAQPVDATAVVDVSLVADTTVVKTLLTNPIVAGRPVTFRLDVTNAGPASARDTVLSDALPAGTSLRSATTSAGTPCVTARESTQEILQCPVGRIPVGGSASATVVLDTASTLTGSLANTAVVGSGGLDPNTPGNTSTATGEVTAPPPPPPPPPTPPPSTPPPSPPPSTPAGSTPGSTAPAPPATEIEPPSASSGADLADTGVPVRSELGIAAGLLLTGVALLVLTRRRRIRVDGGR